MMPKYSPNLPRRRGRKIAAHPLPKVTYARFPANAELGALVTNTQAGTLGPAPMPPLSTNRPSDRIGLGKA